MYVFVVDVDDDDPCYVIVHISAIIIIRLKLDCYNVPPSNTVPFVHQVILMSTCGCTTL